jgi:hypothetical protein
MIPMQSAFIVLATLLGTAGLSVSASALSIPHLPRFRDLRRQAWLLAGSSLALAFLLLWGALGR